MTELLRHRPESFLKVTFRSGSDFGFLILFFFCFFFFFFRNCQFVGSILWEEHIRANIGKVDFFQVHHARFVIFFFFFFFFLIITFFSSCLGEASGHDIRIVEVEKSIKFEQLLDKLQSKYSRRLILQFKDSGESIWKKKTMVF